MTEKIYDSNPYLTEFDAEIVSISDKDVILNRTAFFPEEGGQTPDRGKIDGINVTNVRIEGDTIIHTLESAIDNKCTVHGVVDWIHRFDNMQQHSGEHIFSGLVHNKYGYNNVGFHLSDNICTMDFDGELTDVEIEELEHDVNEVIVKDVEIKAYYPSKESLKNMEYRSKKEIDGDVRIVIIGDVDKCACCAPHVKSTGQIGMLKVLSFMRHRGGVRISIAAGFRALNLFREKMHLLESLVNEFTTAEENIPAMVVKLKEENKDLKYKCSRLNREYMINRASEISEEVKSVTMFTEDADMNDAREIVNELVKKHNGYCGVFVGTDKDGYKFVIGSNELNCKELADDLRSRFGAKCGGSEVMIQGNIDKTEEEIRKEIEIKYT